MPRDLTIRPGLVIPAADLELRASRSGGPGGQHANKADTRMQLFFDLEGTSALDAGTKGRLRQSCAGRITRDGRLVLACSRHRERSRNQAELFQRLAALVQAALRVPTPRRPTRPSRAARLRRRENKRRRGRTKRLRGRVRGED